jgi:hypothetical protein
MAGLDRRGLFAGALGAIAGGTALGAAAAESGSKPTAKSRAMPSGDKPPQVGPRNIRGKILYIGDDDKERGREWFGFSFREDGQITLRAYCEIDDARVERDVVYTMTRDFRPLDCFVRLHAGGKFLGSGWIRVTDTEAECEVFNVTFGRAHQRVPLAVPAPSLGSHPLAADVLHLARFDHARPERVQTLRGTLTTSELSDGASGPFLTVHDSPPIEYVGPERVTTPAGTFDTQHYRFQLAPRPDGRPHTEDIWCLEPDFTFVRAEVRGYLKNASGFGRYELVELSR